MEVCKWIYHKGLLTGTHFATATCCGRVKSLPKIKESAPGIGCADVYNWQVCPECGKPIELDYSSLGKEKSIL